MSLDALVFVDGIAMYAVSVCCSCGDRVTFDPDTVPSIRVDGIKRPLCRACFDRWNLRHRISRGLAPVPLHPSAYKDAP